MIAATHMMKPLPIRPVEPITTSPAPTSPLPMRRRMMHPLPVPTPLERLDLVDALRTAASHRMMSRTGVQQPLPVVDPAA